MIQLLFFATVFASTFIERLRHKYSNVNDEKGASDSKKWLFLRMAEEDLKSISIEDVKKRKELKKVIAKLNKEGYKSETRPQDEPLPESSDDDTDSSDDGYKRVEINKPKKNDFNFYKWGEFERRRATERGDLLQGVR